MNGVWERVLSALRLRDRLDPQRQDSQREGPPRRITLRPTRALVEIRGVPSESLAAFERALQALVRDRPEVQWVHVNPWVHRAVFAFDTDAITRDVLFACVEEAEREVGATAFVERTAGDLRDLPDDELLEFQRSIEVLAEVGGLGLGLGLRLLPFAPTRTGVNLVALLSLVQLVPALRRRLDERWGSRRVDLALSLGLAFGNALAERPLSSLVEIGSKSASLREMRARRHHWLERVDDLCAAPQVFDLHDIDRPLRPAPIPNGRVETYVDRAMAIAASSASVTLMTTWSLRRSTAALFAALPLPARLGRELFCAELSRSLADHGTLVLSPEALQRLDRVDCLVIGGDLVSPARFFVGDVNVCGDVDADRVRSMVADLFDPQLPLEVHGQEGFRLGPAQRLGASVAHAASDLGMPLAKHGSLVLALTHKRRLAAVVEVRMEKRQGLEDLMTVARKAGLRVVVASDRQTDIDLDAADETVPAGDHLPMHIHRLQSAGHVVAVIAAGHEPALEYADCAIALSPNGGQPTWSADVLCSDVSSLARLVYAARVAREVSGQSVRLAMAAAAIGTMVSMGGSLHRASRRVMFVVNLTSLFAMVYGARRAATLARRPLLSPRDSVPWHALDVDAVLARLGTDVDGLSVAESSVRPSAEGAKLTTWQELVTAVGDELFNPLSPLLAAGAGLSALAGSTIDASMVAGVGTINAVVGGYQRFHTERAIRALVQSADPPVRVRRAGQIERVPAQSLVVGDVVELSVGERVPADIRIIEAYGLEVDAGSLTGESLPVSKGASASFESQIADRSSMLFSGTAIAAGEVTGVIVAVGASTEAHRGGDAIGSDLSQGGIEERLRGLISITGPLVTAAGLGLVITGLLRGRTLDELLGSGVSLAVAAVPEGLPLLATAAQLSAARRLSERGALVRNARCVEALGRVDVLCFDKTGTLTEGRIVLRALSDGLVVEDVEQASGPRQLVLAAALRAATRLPAAYGQPDPIDTALVQAGRVAGVAATDGALQWEATAVLPFESGRGYQCVFMERDGETRLSVKGAPEVVLSHCTHHRSGHQVIPIDDATRAELNAGVERLARLGLRVLAVAERSVVGNVGVDPASVHDLAFVGLLAFSDAIRSTAHAAVVSLRTAGVRTVMITGDHVTTATAIAGELGIGTEALTGSDLTDIKEDDLVARIEGVSVFARVTPSQKIRIVRALQRAGRVVAMAGDGANDVPAIRAANVGLAVGAHCTPSARAAADIVLADARIESIVEAIIEGRAMWSAVRDAVAILVGGNLGEIAFTLGAGLVSGRPPLSPRQLLLVNFFTDVAPAMAIALRPPSPETRAMLSSQPPGAALGPILTRDIFARALVTTAGASSAWLIGRATGTRARANTIALAALVGTQLAQTLAVDAVDRDVVLTSIGSALVMGAIIQTPGVSHLFGCRPLGPLAWLTVIGSAAAATSLSTAAAHGVNRAEAWIATLIGEPPPAQETRIYVQTAPSTRDPRRPLS